jgi:MFS family permease
MADVVIPEEGGVAPVAAIETEVRGRPVREVMASPDFRRYWIAQFLSALGGGSLRFTFVWLALDLSDASSAPGLVSVALGIPGLFITIPAGVWSDRLDRRLLIVRGQSATAAVLVVTAVAAWTDVMSLPLAAVLAAVLGGLLASVAPALQALVPALVPPERLMTGVALQGMGQNAALLFGAVLGGATIAAFGVGGAFAVLAALQLLSALSMARIHIDARPASAAKRGMRGDIGEGLRFVLRTEPMRSLLAIGLLAGFVWGVVSVLLPEVAKDDLDLDALGASLLFTALGVGLLATSILLASRRQIARPGLYIAIALSTGLGACVVVMGWSRSYALTLFVMLLWGVGGGTTMTLQRGLLQKQTPDELMGRVMGVNALAMLGSFPLAAGFASVLSSAVGPGDALMLTGFGAMVLAVVLGWRVRNA